MSGYGRSQEGVVGTFLTSTYLADQRSADIVPQRQHNGREKNVLIEHADSGQIPTSFGSG